MLNLSLSTTLEPTAAELLAATKDTILLATRVMLDTIECVSPERSCSFAAVKAQAAAERRAA